MKQKIVIRVHMSCDKCRSKALGLVASTYGVERVEIEGGDKLVVVGDVDSAGLTKRLRKKIGNGELLTVQTVGTEAKPATETSVTLCPQQWSPSYYSWPAMAYPCSNAYCYPYSV